MEVLKKEASESFHIALDEFLKYTVNKRTLFEGLMRLGWKVRRKKITKAPSIEDLVSSNEHLAEISKEKDYKKIQDRVTLPAFA